MHTENFFIDDRSNRQTVETVSEGLPQLDVVSPFALIIEAIDSVNRCTLMVASQ